MSLPWGGLVLSWRARRMLSLAPRAPMARWPNTSDMLHPWAPDGTFNLPQVFQQRYSELQQFYSSLTSNDWERPCFHRMHLQTIRGYVHLRMAEVSYHTWDLKAGLETSPRLLPEVVPALVEWLPTWFRWGFFPSDPLDHFIRYRFEVSGPQPLPWDVAVLGD